MVVMVVDRPRWVCDICRYDMPVSGGEALYNRPSGTRHYPAPLVVYGDACASLAEGRLVAGEIERLPWAAFVQTLGGVMMRFAEPYWEVWVSEVERPQQARQAVEDQETARRLWGKYLSTVSHLNRRPVRWKGGRRR
jgi:hypothetical protein